MIRIVIENVFFLLLPTILYIVWIAFSEDEWAGLGTILSRAPLIRLFFAGAALMIATLVAFSTYNYNSPQDVYVPPSVVDGKLEPGHSIREPQTDETKSPKL
jgi:Family of unknown function (DUF6111)